MSGKGWTLNLWHLILSPGSVRTELNVGSPAGVWEFLGDHDFTWKHCLLPALWEFSFPCTLEPVGFPDPHFLAMQASGSGPNLRLPLNPQRLGQGVERPPLTLWTKRVAKSISCLYFMGRIRWSTEQSNSLLISLFWCQHNATEGRQVCLIQGCKWSPKSFWQVTTGLSGLLYCWAYFSRVHV